MSYTVNWSERATMTASRYLDDDPTGLTQLLDATDALTDAPRPAGSVPYGGEDLRRMRVARYRVLYEIDPTTQTIIVLHVGRVA